MTLVLLRSFASLRLDREHHAATETPVACTAPLQAAFRGRSIKPTIDLDQARVWKHAVGAPERMYQFFCTVRGDREHHTAAILRVAVCGRSVKRAIHVEQ